MTLVLTIQQATELTEYLRKSGRSVIFTNGCFDLLTTAHVSLLEWAKSQGDCLIVGLNTDESIRRLKGESRPVCPLDQRATVLVAVRWVDAVVPFDSDAPTELCMALRPDVMVKGGDYAGRTLPGSEFCGTVKLSPYVDGVSTSSIIERILAK